VNTIAPAERGRGIADRVAGGQKDGLNDEPTICRPCGQERRAALLAARSSLRSREATAGAQRRRGSYLVALPLAIIVPIALARLRRDPRLAIACSLLAAEIAMYETADHSRAGGYPSAFR
jgi:hypothetical protein